MCTGGLMLPNTVVNTLARGIEKLSFTVSPQQQHQLLKYLSLLNKWNAVHNLTAIRDIHQQVIMHLLDSLVVVPYLTEVRTLADIGSGAGLPAIILAIMYPEMQIYAVESSGKKSAFIRRVAIDLGLQHLTTVTIRAEKWQCQPLDVVISRALASAERFIELTGHLGDLHTRWLIMKARKSESFHVSAFSITANTELNVPLLNARRSLIEIHKVAA